MTRLPERPAARILACDEAVVQVRDWQAAGLTVAATAGAFDLLHDGHLHLLRAARQQADRLLVALHQDDRIRQARGLGRPVHPLHERAELLAALTFVDLVTMAAANDAAWLAEARPDVLVLSTDDDHPSREGAELVLPPGTRGVYVPRLANASTTTLVSRIRRNASSPGIAE